MDKLTLNAYAKVNLSLDILKKRFDGYHEVKMLMQTVDLHDKLLIRIQDKGIKIKTNVWYVPSDERNVVFKISKAFLKEYKIDKGVYINLIKRIPVSAGLGGGSSDAATVLVGLNKIFGLNLKRKELMEFAKNFGADIPFCLLGGTALAEGIGEKLTPLPALKGITILICKPKPHISTEFVYENFNFNKVKNHPNMDLLINAIKNKDINTLAKNMVNVMESVTANKYPVIKDIKNIMNQNKSLGSVMSGSGTSVLGIFSNKYDACLAAKRLKKFSREIFVTKTINFE